MDKYPFVEDTLVQYNGNIVISHTSKYNGLKYQYIIPQNIFMRQQKNVRVTIFASICICFFLGCIAVFLTTQRNLQPITLIAEKVVTSIDKGKETNRFNLADLQEYVDMIIADNKKNKSIIAEQKELTKPALLQQMLVGSIVNEEHFKQKCIKYDILFPYQNYFVILFEITQKENNNTDNFNLSVINSSIKDIGGKMLRLNGVCYIYQNGELSVGLINADISGNEMMNTFENAVRNLIVAVEGSFHIDLYVYISSIYSSFHGISSAYKEVSHMYERRILFNYSREKISYFSKMDVTNRETGSLFGIQEQKRFYNYIKAENFEEAQKFMNEIIDDIFSKGITMELARCYMFSIINTMINVLSEISTQIDHTFFESLNPYSRLLNCTNIKILKEQMDIILNQLKEYIDESNDSSIKEKIYEVNLFIKDNYTDQNLNVSMIADHFNSTISSLSRFYKKHSQEGLLDVINKYRIEQAKTHLKHRESIKDIALEVGFTDSNAFIRIFKNYEGITPGKYRLLYSKKDKECYN